MLFILNLVRAVKAPGVRGAHPSNNSLRRDIFPPVFVYSGLQICGYLHNLNMEELFDTSTKIQVEKCIEVLNSQFPDEEEETAKSSARMLLAMHGLPSWVAFNVAFINGKLHLFFSTVPNQTIAVDDAVFSSYLFSETRRMPSLITDSRISVVYTLAPAVKNIAYHYATLEDFKEADPLAFLTNAVYNERGEDALIQIVFQGIRNETWRKIIGKMEARLVKDPQGVGFMRFIAPGLYGADMMGRMSVPPTIQKELTNAAYKKLDIAFNVNVNVGAETERRAKDLVHVLDTLAQMNYMNISGVKSKDFLITPAVEDRGMLMVSKELASIVHLPSKKVKTPTIETTSVRVLTVPPVLDDGIEICKSYLRGRTFPVRVTERDLATHFTVLGSTGTGKSTFIVNMAKAFMSKGWGFAVIDPQDGRLLRRVVALAKKMGREKDIVWFNPFNNEKVITLNPLNPWKGFDPESLAALLTDAFYRVWRTSWGPRLEYLLHMALLSMAFLNRRKQEEKSEDGVIDESDKNFYTLTEVFYVYLKEELFKAMVNQLTLNNFESISNEITAVTDLLKKSRQWSDVVSPILNKMGIFTLNEGVNRVFNSGESSVDMRELIKENKILLIDLKTKKAKDIARVIGNVLIALIYQALQETVGERHGLYGLFLDEAHNFAGEALSTMIQEGRQIGVSIVAVTQFVGSLLTDSPEETQKIREAFLSVPRNFIQFGTNDVPLEVLDKFNSEFFNQSDFNKLPALLAYAILSIDNKPEGPTVIHVPLQTTQEEVNAVREEDYYTKYHKSVSDIDEEYELRKKREKEKFKEETEKQRFALAKILSSKIEQAKEDNIKTMISIVRGRITTETSNFWDVLIWGEVKAIIQDEKIVFSGDSIPADDEDEELVNLIKDMECSKELKEMKKWVVKAVLEKHASIASPYLWKYLASTLSNARIENKYKDNLDIAAFQERMRKDIEEQKEIAKKSKETVDKDAAVLLEDFTGGEK